MALCKTDLAILRSDPSYERALSIAYNKNQMAINKIAGKYGPKFDDLEAAYLAARRALEEKCAAEVDKKREKFLGQQSAIRERAIKRLKLRHFDVLDEDGMAQ
jgi:hypothetical protein